MRKEGDVRGECCKMGVITAPASARYMGLDLVFFFFLFPGEQVLVVFA